MLESPAEREYLNCIRCGLCLTVCPTYREYLRETVSPRGRVALSRQGLTGQLEVTPNLMEQMNSCLACMACNEICPVGLKPAQLVLAMRHVKEQSEPARWKRWVFGGLLPHPRRIEWASLPLRLYQWLGIRWLVYRLGLRWLLPRYVRDLEAMLPRVPLRPLRPVLPEVTAAQGERRHRVGFFLGCAQSLLFASESLAAVRVLTRNGCEVTAPPDVQCCGMPAYGYGCVDQVRDMARHNVAVFERYELDAIVTDCATCGSTLKEYSHLLANDPEWAERAAAFSKKVRDVSEYLTEIPLEKPAGSVAMRVTYHDPCHLRRGQGVWREPRSLLKMVDGVELVELPEANWCCGSAGSQLITHPETSGRVMDRKMQNVAGTDAQVVASGCPGCRMQLIAGAKRCGLEVRVVHPVVVLDEGYGRGEATDGHG